MNRFCFLLLILLFASVSAAQTLGDKNGIVHALDVYPEKNLLAAILNKTRVELWNYETKTLLKEWTLDAQATSIAFSNSYFAVTKVDGFVETFSVSTFERLSQEKITENPLSRMIVTNQGLIVSDTEGNIFAGESVNSKLSFRKLVSLPDPVTGLDFITEKNVIVTSHGKSIISFWSLADGKLLSQQDVGQQSVMALKSNAEQNSIVITFQNGRANRYTFTAETLMLKESNSYSPGGWPVALDYSSAEVAIGTTNGSLMIYTPVATYKSTVKAMVNCLVIIRDELPSISVALGTHGSGIILVKASEMKVD